LISYWSSFENCSSITTTKYRTSIKIYGKWSLRKHIRENGDSEVIILIRGVYQNDKGKNWSSFENCSSFRAIFLNSFSARLEHC